VHSSFAFVALENYSGWFDVDGGMLLYDGGSVVLGDPPPPETPEPGTWAMLAGLGFALGCVRLHRYGLRQRRR
jgi:hypothetical protein